MKEIWKDVKGQEGRYQVSNIGNVRSLLRGKILTKFIDRDGYYRVQFFINGKQKQFYVHVLVYEAFYGDHHTEDGFVVDHKNGNKLDNRVSNFQLLKDADNLRKGRTKKSGLPRGVYKASNGGYTAGISNGSKRYYLGCFKNVLEAKRAYEKARKAIEAGEEVIPVRQVRFFAEDGYKVCTCCGETKPLSEFYLHSGKPYGKCKECMKEYVYSHRYTKK